MDTYPIVPPLPEFERKTDFASTDRGGATTDKALSPEQLASQASQDALLTDSIHQTADARDVADRKAALEAQHAKEMADEAGRQAQLDAVATAKSQEAIAAAKQRLTSKQADYDKAPSPSFFHHGDTWGNALRGMALGLGTLGDSMQKAAMVRIGQAPPNIDTVGDIIGADLQKQEHHIARLKDNVVMAHTGLADANEARAQMIADRHQAAATAYDRLIKLAAARMASLGYDNNRIAQSDEIIKLREKRETEKAQAVAPLTRTVEGHWLHKGEQVSETSRRPAPAPAGQIPKTLTDMTSDEDLPVDATKTEMRQHTAAVGKLAGVGGFLKIAKKTMDTHSFGPPELASKVGFDTTKTADTQSDVIAMRRAYAVANGESVNESSEKSQDIIPDAPSVLSTDATIANFKAKVANAMDKVNTIRKQELANAGVPRETITRVTAEHNKPPAPTPGPAPAPTQPPPLASPPPAPVAAPAPRAEPPPPPDSAPEVAHGRADAIRMLRANPNRPGAAAVMRQLGITREELYGRR